VGNPFDLTGRSILVTGASSGIGRSTALTVAQRGAKVVLVGRNVERLGETAQMIGRPAGTAEAFDLAATEAIPKWMKDLSSKVGPLAGIVHCAGIHLFRPLRFLEFSDVRRVLQINLESGFALAKGFRQKGVCHPPASMVFVSSVVGMVGQPGVSAYAASKGAVISMVKSLALELARDGIRVNAVAPGFVKTEMTERMREGLTPEQYTAIEAMHPLGIGTPDDVANAIAFLCGDGSRWITGSTLVVDGGYSAH
jgi:NAD(P)-dependent dehydrogenase (short-subunit alcohol dehydrogenase family)